MRPWTNVRCKPFGSIRYSHIRIYWLRMCFFTLFFRQLRFFCALLLFVILQFLFRFLHFRVKMWMFSVDIIYFGEMSLYKMLRCNFISEVHCLPLLFVCGPRRGREHGDIHRMTNNVVTVYFEHPNDKQYTHTHTQSIKECWFTFLILSHNL